MAPPTDSTRGIAALQFLDPHASLRVADFKIAPHRNIQSVVGCLVFFRNRKVQEVGGEVNLVGGSARGNGLDIDFHTRGEYVVDQHALAPCPTL